VAGLFFNLGRHINGSSQRIFLGMYPVLVFLAAHILYKNKLKSINFTRSYFPKFIILGNLFLLFSIFLLPRLNIIIESPSINDERILTTNQIKDIYNSSQFISEFAYNAKKVLPQDAIVLFPDNEAKGFVSAKSIIFPAIGISITRPYKVDLSILEPYRKSLKKLSFEAIYFASKKKTLPLNISSLKNTVIYDDGNWHILKLEL